MPIKILRIEAALLFAFSVYLFFLMDISWLFVSIFFFAPDLSLLGYLLGKRKGAYFYNAAHSSIGPILLLAGGFFLSFPLATHLACVWWSHVNFDRMLGFGLKYRDGFEHTHLNLISLKRRKGFSNAASSIKQSDLN